MKRSQSKKIRLIVSRRSYSTPEIANLLGVHGRTVQAWHKAGLAAIDENSKPLLFRGGDVKRFLVERREARRIKLDAGQFNCMKCRAGRYSDPGNTCIVSSNKRIGKEDESVTVKGICNVCGCRMNRFSTKREADSTLSVEKATRRETSLLGTLVPAVNTDIERDRNNEKQHQE